MQKLGFTQFLPILLGAIVLGVASPRELLSRELIIAAVRVEFQPDTSSGTAGNGQFVYNPDFEVDCPDFSMDPPPHDKVYFHDQLSAAKNYWNRVSQGAVDINLGASVMMPAGNTEAYLLPHEMAYYHPFDRDFDADAKLAAFVEDVVAAVGTDIDFTQFNTFVIFHAGLGGDFEFALDPTPGNLPSAYFSTEELTAQGVSANVPNALIIPESQNMLHFPETREMFLDAEDPCFYQFGLNGTLALMLGFRLGLSPMYDTESGRALIGKFGLMDQGAANMQGVAPAEPNPFSRIQQGWEAPEPIFVGDTVQIHINAAPLKFQIAPQEYFLIENKQRNLHPTPAGYREWIVNTDTAGVQIANSGVVLQTDEPGAGYPGNGLLIWHVDENKRYTDANPNGGSVQMVDLMEGDGAQDMGNTTRILFGEFLEEGWWFDPWFAGNVGWFDLNRNQRATPDSLVRFGPDTRPSTISNTSRPSHLALEKISRPGETMSFVVTSNRLAGDRFVERVYGAMPDDIPTVVGKMRSQDTLALFQVNAAGNFTPSGNVSIPLDSVFKAAVDSTLLFHYPYFVTNTPAGNRFYDIRDGDVFTDPSQAPVSGLSAEASILSYWVNTADSGYVYKINTTLNQASRYAVRPDSILGMIGAGQIIATDSLYHNHPGMTDHAIAVDGRGFLPLEFQTTNDGDNWGYLYANTQSELVYHNSSNEIHMITTELPRFATPLHADTGPDPEFLLVYDDQIKVISVNGTLFPNSPWSVAEWIGNPLIGWFTGGELPEIFLRHPDGWSIYNIKGKLIDSGSLSQVEPDRELEIFVTGNESWQIIGGNSTSLKFSSPGDIRQPLWSAARRGNGGSQRVRSILPQNPTSDTLMDKTSVFNYPNPVRGDATTFRVLLGEADGWEVDIFSLSGGRVARLRSTNPTRNTYNELVWDTSSIGNGVYLVRVEATGSDGSSTGKILKVMVIH
ncbi:MAG: T9SS type A sorting domain-containing protein [Candidatus Marinimicrobia bacterium]|nr:T9SS type A sorting domain-containing protein [Candidatus Neomarinimicrobiota bacterium]MCF7839199.1 T9SS type A sorting domain-containing protein [Candidatus Neomarinimicrobiota bacterium]